MDKTANALQDVAAATGDAYSQAGQMLRDDPGLAAAGVLGRGIRGGVLGGAAGGLIGLGHGAATGRPVGGAVRGAGRGALTLGGAYAGGAAGSALGAMAGANPLVGLLLGLGGAGAGGLAGWAGGKKLLGRKEEKQANDPSSLAFADALQGMATNQLRGDALRDVGNIGVTALGVGAAGRGLLGLIQMLRSHRPKKTRSGPTDLPLPYPEKVGTLRPADAAGAARTAVRPVAGALGGAALGSAAAAVPFFLRKAAGRTPGRLGTLLTGLGMVGGGLAGGLAGLAGGTATANRATKAANFAAGDAATTKSGIPWYGPAMLFGGLAGLAGGWKGMDALIDARRRREQQEEMDSARQEFHDALLGQYAKPGAKQAADGGMGEAGRILDALFEKLSAVVTSDAPVPEKRALDLGNLAGQAAGGYGMYAGLSGLLTGALIYDKMQKRSRRAILEKALQRRQRRRFMQQPTELYAQPEPIPAGE